MKCDLSKSFFHSTLVNKSLFKLQVINYLLSIIIKGVFEGISSVSNVFMQCLLSNELTIVGNCLDYLISNYY